MRKINQPTGFTLIEVMLAMTLLSIMVTLLFASLQVCAESWNKGEAKIAEVNEKAVVYQFFKRQLPSIRPLWDDFSEQGNRKFSFEGTHNTLQFVSTFPSGAGRKGLQLFEIKYDYRDDGLIKVNLSPFYPLGGDQKEDEVILIEQVKSLKISYFQKGNINEEGEWESDWLNKEQLPSLIKIKIKLNNDSFWPDMIFALKLSSASPEFSLDTR